MLSVIYTECLVQAECRFAECHFTECHFAECRCALLTTLE